MIQPYLGVDDAAMREDCRLLAGSAAVCETGSVLEFGTSAAPVSDGRGASGEADVVIDVVGGTPDADSALCCAKGRGTSIDVNPHSARIVATTRCMTCPTSSARDDMAYREYAERWVWVCVWGAGVSGRTHTRTHARTRHQRASL
jgi:hypothetical protein